MENEEEGMMKDDALYYAMEIMKERTKLLTAGSNLNASTDGANIPTDPISTKQLIKDAASIYNYLNDYK